MDFGNFQYKWRATNLELSEFGESNKFFKKIQKKQSAYGLYLLSSAPRRLG
jgi:hypothetical protein